MRLFDSSLQLSWQSVTFDRSLEVEDAHRFVLSVVSGANLKRVVLETLRGNSGIEYRIGSERPSQVASLLTAFLPGVTVQPSSRVMPSAGTAWRAEASSKRRSLEVGDEEAVTQRLLGALAVKGAVHQIVIDRRLRPISVPIAAEGLVSETWPSAMIEAAAVGNRRYDGELRRAMAAKQAEAGADVSVRLVVPGERAQALHLVAGYAAVMRSVEAPGLRIRVRAASFANAVACRAGRRTLAVNATELTRLLGWPFGERSYEGLDRSGSRLLPVPSPSGDRAIGRGVHLSSRVDVGLSARDGLRHMWAMGPTGVGKSTLLENMALNDIEAGRGVVVIDPKGDLVDCILSRVRDRELERIVVLDAARSDRLVGFNPLAVHRDETELAVDGILHVLRALNSESWGPRTQDIVHAGLLTLARSDKPTLVALPQLLLDQRFRRAHTSGNLPPALRSFWNWYEALSEAERASVIAPVLNKIRPFTMRSSLRATLGQTAPLFDMNTVFTERKVLLVPLRKGQIGSGAATLLGALVFSRLWQLTQGRAAVPAERRHAVFAYLDEFQDYLRLPTDFTDVLTQARGLGLGLVLAHQHLKQLSPDVRAAVSANAQTSVMFRLGDDDAQVMARPTEQLDAIDFSSLKRYSAYANVLVDGQRSGYGSIKTPPPRKTLRSSTQTAAYNAERWGVAPELVDASLYGPRDDGGEAPIGSKKRGRK